MEQFIAFNPDYVLKPDDGRALIMAAQTGRNMLTYVNENFETCIHPLYALILCFIDGREKQTCIASASASLHISPETVERFVTKLTDNANFIEMKTKDGVSTFPPYTLRSLPQANPMPRFDPGLFRYKQADVRNKRHFTPSSITLMVNNICATDCYYCYCDKRRKVACQIPLERIKALVQEAKKLHVRTFDVIGGEFFLYKNWREVLSELVSAGYNPYLSTKIPLEEEVVRDLAGLKIQDMQISLDTFIELHLIESLHIREGYAAQMKQTLRLLEKYGIPVMIHTVLSQKNRTVEDMASLFDFLKDLKNIIEWKIDKAGASLYTKTDYKEIEISGEDLDRIARYIDGIREKLPCGVRAPRPAVPNRYLPKNIRDDFFRRGFCSGNYSTLFILPDGKVTVCEELYWTERFLVGNVLEQSLEEVWNSEKAKALFYFNQKDMPADSLCHSCADFTGCRSLKQVCYREVVKKYGAAKWYYPDVSCPYATGR